MGVRAVSAAGNVRFGVFTVATLPSAASAGNGAAYVVTDANATTPGTVAAGSGANKVIVVSDGTSWRIC